MLDAKPDLKVVAEAADGAEAVEQALKSAADTDIVDAVRAAMRGDAYIYSSAMATLVREYVDRHGRGEEQFDVLTPSELEVAEADRRGPIVEGDRRAALDQHQDR